MRAVAYVEAFAMSELQRRIAAQTAARSFTKHLMWLDRETWKWTAFSKHPYYDFCRKLRDNHGDRRLPARVPAYWEGSLGLYLFASYLAAKMPRPSEFHDLKPIEMQPAGVDLEEFEIWFAPGNMEWVYRGPRRRLRAKAEQQLRELGVSPEDRLRASPEGWVRPEEAANGGACKEGAYRALPEGRAQMPEGFRGVRVNAPSWVDADFDPDICLCNEVAYWADCSCRRAKFARYGTT